MPAPRYTLWGWTSRWPSVTQPLRVTSGNLRDCKTRERQFHEDYPDALTGIYAPGDAPTGLRLQVQERIHPTTEGGLIMPGAKMLCQYTVRHRYEEIPAVTELDCGPVLGMVPACQNCADLYA